MTKRVNFNMLYDLNKENGHLGKQWGTNDFLLNV